MKLHLNHIRLTRCVMIICLHLSSATSLISTKMVFDRLEEFKSHQKNEKLNDKKKSVIMINPFKSNCSKMKQFLNEVENSKDCINKMASLVEQVKLLHGTILSEPQTDEKMKQQLEKLMDDIKQTASQTKIKLKTIEQNTEQVKQRNLNSAEYRICLTQYSMLRQMFSKVMTNYNKSQVDYRERCKARIQRQLKITGKVTTNEEIEKMLESGNITIFNQDIITDTLQIKHSLADIEARHGDIIKLENSIRELHDMFIDMAMLVEEQESAINRIETHVQNALDYVEDGVEHIEIAKEYHQKWKKVLISITFIILAVIIGILAYVLI